MRRRDRNSFLLIALTSSVAIFGIGGAHRLTVCVVAFLAAAAAAVHIASQRRFARVSPMIIFIGAAAGLTALQLVPVPAGLMAALHPTGYDLAADAARALGEEPPAWLPLSLDPAGTFFELVKLLAYLAVAFAALRVASAETGRYLLIASVAGAAIAAAVIALVHEILGVEALYGIYEPRQAHPPLLGPLLNGNHFAGFLATGALLGAALALHGRQPMLRRVAWAGGGVMCMVEALMMHSRGAAIALALGSAALVGMLALQWWRRRGRARDRHQPHIGVPATIVAVCGLTLVVFFSAGRITEEIADTKVTEFSAPRSKYVAWQSSTQLLAESPWVGVGRGAFEPAFTRVHPASAFFTYSHLENEYLQAVVDWGVPGGLLLGVLVGWVFLRALRRWNDGPLAAGAFAVLIAVGAQSFVDFGLEMPGVAIATILVASTLLAAPLKEMPGTRRTTVRVTRAAFVAAVVVAATLLATPLGRTLHETQADLRDDERSSLAAGRAAMARHPVDYFAAAYTAHVLIRDGRPEATDALNRALALHPTHPQLHRFAARLLLATGSRRQALVEYSLAIGATLYPVDLLEEVLREFPIPAEAALAIPPDYMKPGRMTRILREMNRQDVAVEYLLRAVRRDGHDRIKLELLGDLAVATKNAAAAELVARKIATIEATLETRTHLARVLYDQRKLAEAAEVLRVALSRDHAPGEAIEANLLLADVHLASADWVAAREHLQRMRDEAATYMSARTEIHKRLAVVEEGLGNKEQAEWERQRARAESVR